MFVNVFAPSKHHLIHGTDGLAVVLQIRGFLQSVQQLAKLGFIFSGTGTPHFVEVL